VSSPSKIFVAVPTRGDVGFNTIRRLQDIRDANPSLPPVLYEAGRLSVASVRNEIVRKFLKTDCEILLMVDDDVVPHRDVLAMSQYVRHSLIVTPEPRYDIVGAPYMLLRQPIAMVATPCVFLRGPGGGYKFIPKTFTLTGVVECDAMGTGCMMIARRVVEDPRCMPFSLGVDPDGVMVMTEDMIFCLRAKEAGYTLAADYSRFADHWNSISLNAIHKGYHDAFARAGKVLTDVPSA